MLIVREGLQLLQTHNHYSFEIAPINDEINGLTLNVKMRAKVEKILIRLNVSIKTDSLGPLSILPLQKNF